MRISDLADVKKAARMMRDLGAGNVLIKGGHLGEGEMPRIARDHLFIGDEMFVFESPYIETSATHGTGCTLAAAITANLALGRSLIEAVSSAKDFVTEAIRTAPNLGNGNSPINI
jgi:hydroxymethylpyrimidine kinase/phosphomethylpyrimidine kinase